MLENHAAYGRPHLFSLCRMAWVDNLKRVGGCALHTGTSTWPAVTLCKTANSCTIQVESWDSQVKYGQSRPTVKL